MASKREKQILKDMYKRQQKLGSANSLHNASTTVFKKEQERSAINIASSRANVKDYSIVDNASKGNPTKVNKPRLKQSIQKMSNATKPAMRKVSNTLLEKGRNVKNSWGVKAGMGISNFIGNRLNRYSTAGRMAKGVIGGLSKMKVGKAGMGGLVTLGFTAMASLGVAKGFMGASREKVYDRYMQDQRYSRNMLHNSRVGLASGTSQMNKYGDTQGLSNSLSRTRHGRY